MSTHAVKVVKLEINKHPNAERLEIATVGDYRCIVGKGEYTTGDIAAYIPEQSIVPKDILKELGLEGRLEGKDKNRVKAIRLRGVVSQGIIYKAREGWKPGDDVADELGITKWVPAIPRVLRGEVSSVGSNRTIKYDIENFKRYPEIFVDGEPVVITEKIHGCVPYSAPIRMADGSKKPITKIKIGDYVLGYNKSGQVVPSKVLNKINTGKADQWLRIQGKRYGAGRGNHYFSLTCTPNHKIWCSNKQYYIPAEGLSVGDTVLNFRSNWNITPLQKSILLGKLLGDGYFIEEKLFGAISWGHKQADQEYMDFIANALGSLITGKQGHTTSGYGTPMVRQRTAGNHQILQEFISFKQKGKKIVPFWVTQALDPIAIAFWYMDDGSLGTNKDQEDRAHFAVCNFDKKDCKILQNGLEKFNINSIYYEHSGYSRLRLNADDAERLFLLIAPYIPKCMQHKLPKRYRGGPGWMPKDRQYKNPIVEQTITSIKDVTDSVRSSKWDLTTETHNFFTNDILVHNSFFSIGIMPDYLKHPELGRIMVASKGLAARGLALKYETEKNEKNLYIRVARHLSLDTRVASVYRDIIYPISNTDGQPVFVIGEIFGQGVQDLKYGAKIDKNSNIGFRIFDIFIGVQSAGRFLNDVELDLACKKLDLPRVPVLYRGKYSKGKLMELTNGMETVSGNEVNIREGVVIRPTIERSDDVLGRVQLKSVSEKYLLRGSNATEYN